MPSRPAWLDSLNEDETSEMRVATCSRWGVSSGETRLAQNGGLTIVPSRAPSCERSRSQPAFPHPDLSPTEETRCTHKDADPHRDQDGVALALGQLGRVFEVVLGSCRARLQEW